MTRTAERIGMGKRRRSKQDSLFIPTASLARSPSTDFYERLNQVLSADDFEGLRGLGQDTRIHRCSLRDPCMCYHRPMASLETLSTPNASIISIRRIASMPPSTRRRSTGC